MKIARFGHVSLKQWEETMGSRTAEATPLEEIPLPRRATAGSAGYDFTAPAETVIPPGGSALIPTGIRAEMEPGWVLPGIQDRRPAEQHGRNYRQRLRLCEERRPYHGQAAEPLGGTGDHRAGRAVLPGNLPSLRHGRG